MKRAKGFTLTEVMVAIGIVGVLSAAAIPSFTRYVQRSRTAEASLNLRKLYDSSVAYYHAEHFDQTGQPVDRQFLPSVGVTPAQRCCKSPGGKCKPDPTTFADATWQALRFTIGDPYRFQYQYTSEDSEVVTTTTGGGGSTGGGGGGKGKGGGGGGGGNSGGTTTTTWVGGSFEVSAYGDLDCDGTSSTYMRIGSVLEDGAVSGGQGLMVKDGNE